MSSLCSFCFASRLTIPTDVLSLCAAACYRLRPCVRLSLKQLSLRADNHRGRPTETHKGAKLKDEVYSRPHAFARPGQRGVCPATRNRKGRLSEIGSRFGGRAMNRAPTAPVIETFASPEQGGISDLKDGGASMPGTFA